MVRPERFELPTYCSGGNRSIHLSYGRVPASSVYTGRGKSFNGKWLLRHARRKRTRNLLLQKAQNLASGPEGSGSRRQINFRLGKVRCLRLIAVATPTTTAAPTAISATVAATTAPASTTAALGFWSRLIDVQPASAV